MVQKINELDGLVGTLKEFKAKSNGRGLDIKFFNVLEEKGERLSRYFKKENMNVVFSFGGLHKIESSCKLISYSLKELNSTTLLDFTLEIKLSPNIVSACSQLLNQTVDLILSIEEEDTGLGV